MSQAAKNQERFPADAPVTHNHLVATEFKGFPVGYQSRNQLCKEFIRFLSQSAEIDVLLIESRPGIGATSVCAEYLETVQDPAILLTVQAGSRAGYSIPYLLEQGLRQGKLLLGESLTSFALENAASEWQKTLLRLQRQVRSSRRNLHLIVDGLYQIPPEDARYVSDVIKEVLFLGGIGIRHVITWNEGLKTPDFFARCTVRHVAIPPLIDLEAAAFLKASGVADEWVKEITLSTGGVPAKLASVVRLYRLGVFDQLALRASLNEYYELEWQALLSGSSVERDDAENVFAFLVFSKRPLVVSELCNYSSLPEPSLRLLLANNGFVNVGDNDRISFSSNTHRDFFQHKLARLKTQVLNTFVDRLVDEKNSVDSIQLLPTYYEELGRDREIVSILTPQNLDSYLEKTQSLSALRRRNELGLSAAARIQEEVETYRFALQASIVRDFEFNGSDEARLAALAATGHLDDALDIAQGEPTNEGKLLLLAQYAKALFDKGLKIDQVLSNNIEGLIKEVDLSSNRERALTIAEHLVGPFPDLSIAIVEHASDGAKDYQDAAFTHLVLKNQANSVGAQKIQTEKYTSRISDSSLQGFIRATEAVFGSKSAEDIKQSTHGLDGRQRSFFLRQWIRVHAKEATALDIADYALDEVARDSSYLPSASDLRIICLPIADADIFNKEKAHAVLSRIEVQRAALLDVTPTVDRLRLDIEIARAKVSLGLSQFDDELSELYLRTDYLADDGIKLECFCWLYSKLSAFQGQSEEVVEPFVKLLDDGIQKAIEQCLATTAEHLDVFKGAVSALIESNPALALSVVEKINTEERRDKAYRLFSETLISRRSKSAIPQTLLLRSLNSIVDERVRWPAIVNCLSLVAKHKPAFDMAPVGLVAMGRGIDDPTGRAHALSWSTIVSEHYGLGVDSCKAIAQFRETLDAMDQGWLVPKLNYWFIERLAQVDKTAASKMLAEYQCDLGRQHVASQDHVELLSKLAHLTCVSFAGTLRHRLDTEEMFGSVQEVIDGIPSLLSRVTLNVDLAMRAFSENRRDVGDRICEQRLIPLIRNSEKESRFLYRRLVERSFSALHLWNQGVAETLLSTLPRQIQDECRTALAFYYVTGITTSEPQEDKLLKNSRMTWASAITVVELIERMSVDNLMVGAIEDLALGATSRASINEISSSQRATLGGRLLQKIDRDLPDSQNVKHKGWQIVAKAYCYKLMGDTSSDKWIDLISQAKSVPNTSDSVYVLSLIIPHLPPKLANERNAAIKEAETRLKLIPSKIDSVRRAISMSSSSFSGEVDDALAKRLLTTAMKESLALSDSEAASDAQRTIIDQAYQVDKQFAEELVKLIDDDPARIRAKAVAEKSLKSQKTHEAVLDKRYGEIRDDVYEIGSVGWRMLGGLNSNKIPPQKLDDASKLLPQLTRCTLDHSFGYYWWYLRNLQYKYAHSAAQSKANLVPLFEVTRLAAMLTDRITRRVCGGRAIQEVSGLSRSENFMVVPGHADDVLAYIKEWLDKADGREVLLCDPYFKVENIDFIKELSFHKEGLSFVILNCTTEFASGELDSEYEAAWSRIAHVQPPPMRAVHVTYEGEKSRSPIHDRWILCGNSGLRIGTSVGSISGNKLSEISKINAEDLAAIRDALSRFTDMKERTLEGRRLKYRVVQW